MKIEERETWAAERVRDLFEPFGVKPFGAKKKVRTRLWRITFREKVTLFLVFRRYLSPSLRLDGTCALAVPSGIVAVARNRCECSRRFKRDLEKPIKSSQHESLILAQNERWRQA